MTAGMSRLPSARPVEPAHAPLLADPGPHDSELELWRVLDELGPLLELLDQEDVEDDSPDASRSHDDRFETMLALFEAGLDPARRATPAFVLDEAARDHVALSAEERARVGFLVEALRWADQPAHPEAPGAASGVGEPVLG